MLALSSFTAMTARATRAAAHLKWGDSKAAAAATLWPRRLTGAVLVMVAYLAALTAEGEAIGR
eukprot:CAMPEP_0170576296 /NCGR_PEP_ID=MMETSP0224-20130122/4317_1 /TAXON_ID=285029 /ORGANISM="Togula jolla, Strain CCCM 725" /LENGTH=62 /DNA_ID=CAMNT_0010899129 /DNA_START=1040 /DNA_END=1225 /DNA_ORIENTATION=-